MKIQRHKRKLAIGSKTRCDRANWDNNYDAIFVRCPSCKRTRGEQAGCADAFHRSSN